jgi:S-disulfanyl-L-cysteine oxidoreductase SoxD
MICRRAFSIATVFYILHCWAGLAWAQDTPGRTPTIWDGVFTQAQAARGKEAFTTFCAQCHKEDLSGETGPDLAGTRFRTRWDASTLNELFSKILKTMPRGSANLSPDMTVDIVAHILSANNFPAGERTLSANADSLGRIRILGKDGPMPAETGQLVRTLGCLAAGPANGWTLTSALPPERSRNDEPSDASEIQALAARPPGDRSIRLMSVDPDAQMYKGQKVEVKGLLGENSVVVTSLQRIAERCP